MTDDLNALADRIEAATGPDNEADTLIYAAVHGWPVEWRGDALVRLTDFYPIGTIDPGERNRWFTGHVGAPSYTASLDAALTLVPEGATWTIALGVARDGRHARAGVISDHHAGCGPEAAAPTPALALCAAALRARAQQEGTTR